jgi:hypothetical protein
MDVTFPALAISKGHPRIRIARAEAEERCRKLCRHRGKVKEEENK